MDRQFVAGFFTFEAGLSEIRIYEFAVSNGPDLTKCEAFFDSSCPIPYDSIQKDNHGKAFTPTGNPGTQNAPDPIGIDQGDGLTWLSFANPPGGGQSLDECRWEYQLDETHDSTIDLVGPITPLISGSYQVTCPPGNTGNQKGFVSKSCTNFPLKLSYKSWVSCPANAAWFNVLYACTVDCASAGCS